MLSLRSLPLSLLSCAVLALAQFEPDSTPYTPIVRWRDALLPGPTELTRASPGRPAGGARSLYALSSLRARNAR